MRALPAALMSHDGLERQGLAPEQHIGNSQYLGVLLQLAQDWHRDVGIERTTGMDVVGAPAFRGGGYRSLGDRFFIGRPDAIEELRIDQAGRDVVTLEYPLLAHRSFVIAEFAGGVATFDLQQRVGPVEPAGRTADGEGIAAKLLDGFEIDRPFRDIGFPEFSLEHQGAFLLALVLDRFGFDAPTDEIR